jgi:hypothetical protein
MEQTKFVWVFNGNTARFPSGVFETIEAAEHWISGHRLSGVLTRYPMNVGAYDWCVNNGHFKPSKAHQSESNFVGNFSSATFEHFHYEEGKRSGQPR